MFVFIMLFLVAGGTINAAACEVVQQGSMLKDV